MRDFSLMLRAKLPVVDRIHPQSTMVDMGVENKAMGDSKHNDSPGQGINETHVKAFFGQVLAIMYLPNSHSHSSPQISSLSVVLLQF